MPQVVAAWIISSVGVAATSTAAALIQAGTALAFNYAVSALNRPKTPPTQEVQTELRKSDTLRLRHMGRVRASGAVMFYDWRQSNQSGFMDRSRVLHKVLAVGQGGITNVEKWWLGDDVVTLDANDVVADGDTKGYIRLWFRSGTGAQKAGGQFEGMLAEWAPSGAWTTAHRLDGVGCIYGQFRTCNPRKVSTVYPQGDPEITALVTGSPCYDPRDGTAAFSANAARIILDMLTHPDYGALKASDIDTASFAQAITDCDGRIPLRDGGDIARWVAGGSYSLDQTLAEAVQPALDACAGQLYLTPEGTVGLRVGKWRAPTYEITPDKCVSVSIRPGRGDMDSVSTLVPSYTAPETGWQTTTADPWDDAAAIALFGETEAQELDLPWVQHHGQARRLAKIRMSRLNPRFTATIKLRFWGLLLLDQESVYYTDPALGLTKHPMFIESYAFDPGADDGVCTVTLTSADQSAFSWDAGTEEGDPPTDPDAVASAYVPPTPVIDSVSVIRDDGGPYILAMAHVDESAVTLRGRYRKAGGNRWTSMTSVKNADGIPRFRTGVLSDRAQYDVEIYTTDGLFESEAEGVAGSYNIEVYANTDRPAAPVLVSQSGTKGGTLTVVFEPDLGVNYRRTGLYRAAPTGDFGTATLVKWSYATSAQVTMTDTIPATGARYWLQSENPSGITSAKTTLVGTYT